MPSQFQARRLDVAAFAQAQAELSGSEPLSGFTRLVQELREAPPQASVDWRLQGEHRRAPDGSVRPALHLHIQTALPLSCQRCMEALDQPIEVDRHFVFAPDEDTAAHLDEEAEDDVLALSADFDAHALIEDELLMALPLVPRHERCPTDLPRQAQSAGFEESQQATPQPFAALAALKNRSG